MRALPCAILLGAMHASCARPAELHAPIAPSGATTTTTGASSPAQRIGVDVRAPARLRYSRAVLGVPRTPVEVVVTNRSADELDVSDLRLRFAPMRAGASFPCDSNGGPSFSASEPASLAPGAAFVFERWLDCELPLVGSYELRAWVTLGRTATAVHAAPSKVRVVAAGGTAPEPIDDRGLFLAVGTSRFVASQPGRGNVSADVAIVNGSTRKLSTPRVRLLTRVRINGHPLTCASDSATVDVPAALASGTVHRSRVEVPCVTLDQPGVYDIEVRASIDDTREVPFGTLRVEITRDSSTLEIQQRL